jgi:hypothetical protein
MRRESVVESGHEETLSLTTQEIPAAWATWSKNREKPGFAGESPEETEGLWGKGSHGLRVESGFGRTCEHRNHLSRPGPRLGRTGELPGRCRPSSACSPRRSTSPPIRVSETRARRRGRTQPRHAWGHPVELKNRSPVRNLLYEDPGGRYPQEANGIGELIDAPNRAYELLDRYEPCARGRRQGGATAEPRPAPPAQPLAPCHLGPWRGLGRSPCDSRGRRSRLPWTWLVTPP